MYQDRLVKELRLEGISDIARANATRGSGFDDDPNRRFAIEPGDSADYHRSATGLDLGCVFSIEQERKLSANWTLSFENRVYQLSAASRNYSPASRKVHVRTYLGGRLHMFYRGDEIGFTEINPTTAESKKSPPRSRKPAAASGTRLPPSQNHHWPIPWSTKQIMKQQQT